MCRTSAGCACSLKTRKERELFFYKSKSETCNTQTQRERGWGGKAVGHGTRDLSSKTRLTTNDKIEYTLPPSRPAAVPSIVCALPFVAIAVKIRCRRRDPKRRRPRAPPPCRSGCRSTAASAPRLARGWPRCPKGSTRASKSETWDACTRVEFSVESLSRSIAWL